LPLDQRRPDSRLDAHRHFNPGLRQSLVSASLENAQRIRIADYEIRVITAPYFLATKLEAFHGRSRNDFRMSHDLEDIVTVVDGRPEIVEEVHRAPVDVQKYLSDEFRELLSNRDFLEALPGHLWPDAASQQRSDLVVNRMQQFLIGS
jgi:hypothetical protein